MREPIPLETVRTIAVLADCHIHPGGGPEWTPAILAALAGADLIITLGDMGESAGLDRLAEIAPVLGVRGRDDADDLRTAELIRVVEAGGLSLGCVFDPVEAGLARSADPFEPEEDWLDLIEELFDGPVDALLYASTHKPSVSEADDILAVNPGSATLPDGMEAGAPGSFARLDLTGGAVEAEIVLIPPKPA